jgi:replication-associated recombination protein RarA
MINPNILHLQPDSLDDFAISDPQSRTLLASLTSGRLPFPAFGKNVICMWGTYGTGKTTLARLLPKLLEQSPARTPSPRPGSNFSGEFYWDFIACGSGSNSVGLINDLKKRIESDASYSEQGWHYEVFDEVDLLTDAAQASLKATISQAASTIFVFTTNHLDRIDRGLIDRAHLVEMNQPKPSEMVKVGKRLLAKFDRPDALSDETIAALGDRSRGSMRDFGTAVILAALQTAVPA